MHLSKRYAILAGTGLAATLALSACGNDQGSSSGSMSGMDMGSSATSPSGSASATAPAGDVMFAQMMIPHHQQAVEMAELALKNDSASKEVTDLATQVKAAQGPEIETMNRWLREWNAPAAGSMSMGSGGMMTDDDMKKLASASGEDFNRMWVTMMIKHHEGAVSMAESVLQTTANPEVKQMAQGIVEGQKKEIATMKGML